MAILARLSSGEATVNELAAPFAVTVQAVSKHIKVLEHAGLISRSTQAQYRPCRLESEPLDTAVDWIENITIDPRAGGVFETIMMNDSDGEEYTMTATFVAVEPPETIVWTEAGVEGGIVTTVTFKDLGDGTTEVVTHQTNLPEMYTSPEAQAGLKSSFDRVAACLATL